MVGFLAQSVEEIENNFDQLSECCDVVEVSHVKRAGMTRFPPLSSLFLNSQFRFIVYAPL